MTKNIFLILKIWLITIEGIRSDTLDLTQVRIEVSRIKFSRLKNKTTSDYPYHRKYHRKQEYTDHLVRSVMIRDFNIFVGPGPVRLVKILAPAIDF